MDDQLLVRQSLQGQTQAFRLLVIRYRRPLVRFLSGYAPSSAIAEELAQEAFLRAHRSLSSYDRTKGASFSTWLFTIAKRLALNENARLEHRLTSRDEDLAAVVIHADGPLRDALRTEVATKVKQAIGQIDEPFRSALLLSYIDELSVAEAAQILGCSEGTVKSRVYRGKMILKERLEAMNIGDQS